MTETSGWPLWASGPCQYVSEVSGSTLVLKSNQNYQLGAPGFDTLTITVMDKANLLTALIAGDLDYYTFGGSVSEEKPAGWRRRRLHRTGRGGPQHLLELMTITESLASADLLPCHRKGPGQAAAVPAEQRDRGRSPTPASCRTPPIPAPVT